MNPKSIISCLICAWGVPLAIVIVVRMFTPDPNRPKDTFLAVVLTPNDIRMEEKRGRKNSNHFEVWLHSPNGDKYFPRDPNPDPVTDLYHRIPQGVPLNVIYNPTNEGNVIMEISLPESKDKPLLAFADVMAEYSTRRRVVYIVAGLWFTLGTLVLGGLWKVSVKTAS